MANKKYYIRKPKKGFAYFAGEVVELPKKLADRMGEEYVRPATEVLPEDLPGRTKLLQRGLETMDDLKTRVKKSGLQGLALTAKEEYALGEYLKPKTSDKK